MLWVLPCLLVLEVEAGGALSNPHHLWSAEWGVQSQAPDLIDQSLRNYGVEHGVNKHQPLIVPLHCCPGGWGWGGGRGWWRHQWYYSDRWSEAGRMRWTMKGRWKPLLVSQSTSSPERRVSWMMVNLLKQAETTEWARDILKIELKTGPSFSARFSGHTQASCSETVGVGTGLSVSKCAGNECSSSTSEDFRAAGESSRPWSQSLINTCW